MADIADMLGSGAGTEDTIDGAADADAVENQDASTDDSSSDREPDTETGQMSVDTAALGGGAIGDAEEDDMTVTDADGGAR